MKTILYEKKKYFKGGVVIGKREDIVNADPDDIIQVTFQDRPDEIVYNIFRRDLVTNASETLAKNYPNGAWIVPKASCKDASPTYQ